MEKEDHVNYQQLKDQLSTLTTALATVTGQKSKMEASFQADKKKLRVGILFWRFIVLFYVFIDKIIVD